MVPNTGSSRKGGELLTGRDGRFHFAPAATGTWQCSVLWDTSRDGKEKLGPEFDVAPGKTAMHEFRSARD
ncbi:MAG TPA: hypothetical protein VFD82_06845 [Planctomycetota bacterium]|nr:hypothetical protein [Planctomycetota bacterium]